MRIAYFTGGTVGAGHLVRGIAIGRALARAGFDGSYRMFGPALPFSVATRDDYEVVAIRETELATAEPARTSGLARSLDAFAPDLILVDLFWAPLRHVLPIAGCECWLLVRCCPPWWFVGPPTARFDAEQFARVVAIEPMPPREAVRERIDPVVVCNPDERRPRGALRDRLGVASDELLAVATHAGLSGELDAIVSAADRPVARLDLFRDEAIFPAAEWLNDADAVFSAAGYNSFWEAHTLGYADRTRFSPMRRALDDQAWRARACRDHRPAANGADVLAREALGR